MSTLTKQKASILIVEDDSVIASVEEWRLKKMGYEVCGHAVCGTDALAQVMAKKPDLVLLDINIEGDMDGIQVAEVLAARTDIPFIFLTAHGEDAILTRVKGTLQYGYIKKPFSDDDLRIAIDLALSKSRFINRILSNNALYEMTLDQFPFGILVTNNDGVIIYANKNARSITQWQDPPGSTYFQEILKISDDRQGKSLENLRDRVKNEQSTVWLPPNAVLKNFQDKLVPIAGNAAPLLNDNGVPEGMVITLFVPSGDRKQFRMRS